MNIFIYIKHFIRGLHYGYKLCCIHQFCKEFSNDIMSYRTRCKEMGWDECIMGKKLTHVPCSKCAREIDIFIGKRSIFKHADLLFGGIKVYQSDKLLKGTYKWVDNGTIEASKEVYQRLMKEIPNANTKKK